MTEKESKVGSRAEGKGNQLSSHWVVVLRIKTIYLFVVEIMLFHILKISSEYLMDLVFHW